MLLLEFLDTAEITFNCIQTANYNMLLLELLDTAELTFDCIQKVNNNIFGTILAQC